MCRIETLAIEGDEFSVKMCWALDHLGSLASFFSLWVILEVLHLGVRAMSHHGSAPSTSRRGEPSNAPARTVASPEPRRAAKRRPGTSVAKEGEWGMVIWSSADGVTHSWPHAMANVRCYGMGVAVGLKKIF